MMRCKRVLAILVAAVVFASLNSFPVMADVVGLWSPDERVPGYLDDTLTPFLVADRNRTVHAFASQWVGETHDKRAIVYRQWTLMTGWTRPVDIILDPSKDTEILGAFMDSTDTIHIIFLITDMYSTTLNYSFAPAANADLPSAWSFPVAVGDFVSTSSAAIIGDHRHNLVIIYSGSSDGNGLYFVASDDAGATWSEPSAVYLTHSSTLVPYSLRLAVAPDHQARATWNVVTTLGVDKMLYFANYDLPNQMWSTPVELDRQMALPDYFGPSFPAMVDNGEEIVIMYNNGNPLADRPVGQGSPVQEVRRSSDGGSMWNGPTVPFPYHTGRSGEHALVLDGNGTPHALFVQRIEGTNDSGQYVAMGGVWHSVLVNGSWTNPERFVTTRVPHDIRAVVSQGNVLLAVWREDPGIGKHGIWFSYKVLDAPEAPVVPLSTLLASSPIQTEPTTTLVIVASTPLPNDVLGDRAPSSWKSNPAFPLIVGVVPVALLLLGAVAAFRFLMIRRG